MRIRPVSILASTVTLFLLNSSFVSSDTNSPRSVNLSNEIQSASIHGYSYNSSWFRQKSENGHISEQRVLTQQTRGFLNDANFQQGYIDSLGTLYDESAQAWRILGAYIDCSDDGSNDQNYERRGRLNRQERRLENQDGGDDHNSGSGSGSGDGSGDYGGNSGQCSRYLLWAAYADVNHQGGGLGEYKFFNPQAKRWDDSACRQSGSRRCVRLDCHLESSHNFRLLGYYKQYNFNDFMEQLSEHHGSCTWTNSMRSFMDSTLSFWPNGCSYSGVTTEDGINIYIDIQPKWGGKIEIGLYEDDTCVSNYHGTDVNVAKAWKTYLRTYGNDGDNYQYAYQGSSVPELGSSEYFNAWNNALATYQICQPCKVSSIYNRMNNAAQRRHLEDGNQEAFQCQDSAGEVNINQCALFAKDTQVNPAYFNDLQKALRQGSIVVPRGHVVTLSNDYSLSRWQHNWGFFCFSMLVFIVGVFTFACLVKIKTRVRANPNGGNEPLIMTVTPRASSMASSVTSALGPSPSALSTATNDKIGANITTGSVPHSGLINTTGSDHNSRAGVVSTGRSRSSTGGGGERLVASYADYGDTKNVMVGEEPMNHSGILLNNSQPTHSSRPGWPVELEDHRQPGDMY